MKDLISLLFIFLSVPFLFAQNNGSPVETDVNAYIANSSSAQLPTKININSEISGSYYLYNSWDNRGLVFLKKNKILKLNSFNYNAFTDLFEVKISADSSFSFSKENVDSIAINNKIFKVIPGMSFGASEFAEILVDNNNILLIKKYNSALEKAKPNALTGNYDFPDKIKIEESYYIKNGSSFEPVSLNKNSLLKHFKSLKIEIKKFAKANKLSYNKESDIVSIVKFVSELSK